MKLIFKNDHDFEHRFAQQYKLFAIKWVLIMLNDFVPLNLEKKLIAQNLDFSKKNQILTLQLEKAIKFYKSIKFE